MHQFTASRSHIGRVYVCLGVTYGSHFRHIDRDLLRAAAGAWCTATSHRLSVVHGLLFTVCLSVSALFTEQESVCNAMTVTKRLCLSVCLSVCSLSKSACVVLRIACSSACLSVCLSVSLSVCCSRSKRGGGGGYNDRHIACYLPFCRSVGLSVIH